MIESLVKHRYENAYEREVESGIQSRHISEAYETMIRLSRSEFSKDPSISEHEGALIKLCTSRPAINSESWNIGREDNCNIQSIRDELNECGYGLPSNFDSFPQWSNMISDFVQIQFGLALLRHTITSEIKKGNWEILILKENSIMTGMEVDDEFMDIETIGLILETLLVNNYMKGMAMGLGLGQLLADVPKFHFESLGDIMSLFVYPTVYDSWVIEKDLDLMKQNTNLRQDYIKKYLQQIQEEKELQSGPIGGLLGGLNRFRGSPKRGGDRDENDTKLPSKSKRAVMGDGKKALPMVSLEIRLIKLIESPPDEYNEEIIRIMQNVLTDSGVGSKVKGGVIPFERTISALTNRLYLNALLESKRFEEFFGVAITIISVRLIL